MKHERTSSLSALLLTASLALAPGLSQAGVDIAQTPLMVSEPVAPNIMFILDDSGSMGWEHMPGTTATWSSAPVGGLPQTVSVNDIRLRASNINTMWYNPLISYEPWLKYDGSSYPNADYNGTMDADPSKKSGTGTINFKTSFTAFKTLATGSGTSGVGNTAAMSTTTGMVSTDYRWRYSGFYYLTGTDETKVQNYKRYDFAFTGGSWKAQMVNLKTDGTAQSTSTITSFDWTAYGGTTRSVEQELQNYANWFSYYRLRVTMAKAAASRVFAKLNTGYRVGYNTIWNRQAYNIPVGSNKGLFSGTNKQTWFTKLFDSISNNGTPLHDALKRTGDYYKNETTTGPYGPDKLSCRQNFAILTTDGYWNSISSTAVGNSDNTAGTEHTDVNGNKYKYTPELPYKDGNTNTLADVAMEYWKTDLAPSLLNNVPTTGKNPAFWQSMRTYGISIGEKGKLDPTQATLDAIKNGTKNWGTPGNDKQENIDDLWHATVNSRGEFIVARDPNEFARALTNTLMEIASETKSEASGGVNEAKLTADTKAYFSRYTSGQWDGDVFARSVGSDGKQDLGSELWSAEAKLPAWNSRNIKVNNNGSMQQLTGAVGGLSADIVNYLRGDQSKEEGKVGGTLRKRSRLLPAFINSQLVYVGKPSQTDYFSGFSFTGASTYGSYASATAGRTPMIYIAGNNGMLHGFDANTGIEKFAFLTKSAIDSGKLQKYVQPNYGSASDASNPHQYILDGELTVADVHSGGWGTVLVGTQGRGGKGVFALNVSDPNNISLMWEITSHAALGNNMGKPIIAQVGPGDWRVVFGNGPNSTGDKAQLIMISLASGAVTTVDTGVAGNNGLSGVALWDADKDGIFETAYGGDLKGNLWRFNNLGGGASATKIFSAPSNQAISAAPLLVRNQKTDDTWIFVGTGRYLNTDDLADSSQQAWYGIIDKKDGVVATTSSLLERHIDSSSGAGAVVESGTESDILHNEEGKDRGWYINFPQSKERMLMTPNYVLGGALFGFTFIPNSSDPCVPQGSSAIWGINPFSGGRINQGIFLGDDNQPLKIDNDFASVLYGIPVVTSGSPPLTIGEDGKFTIQLPDRSIEGRIPTGEPKRQAWKEIVNQ